MSGVLPRETGRLPELILGIGLMYLAAFQIFKLPPVLPALLETHQYDRTLAGSLMSVYAAAGLVLSVPLGKTLSRHGPLRLSLASLSIAALGNVVGLIDPASGAVMLAARGLEGVGFAGLAIVGPVLANRNAGAAALPIVISLTAIWIPVGQLISGVITPFLLNPFGWSSLWWISLGATLLLGLATPILLGHFANGAQVSPESSRPSVRSLGKSETRQLRAAAAVFTVFSIQYFAFMTWLPQYLVEALGYAMEESSFAYLVPILVVIPASLVTGGLLKRGFGPSKMLLAGMVMIALVWACVPVVASGGAGVLLMVFYGIGAGVSPTCLFAMPSSIVGARGPTAAAFGVVMTGRNLGVLIGPVLLAYVFTVTGGWCYIAPMFCVTTLVGCQVAITLMKDQRRLLHQNQAD